MMKSREVFTNANQRKGMNTPVTPGHTAGQNHFEREVSRQELLAPKWRGPFEGYR